MQILDVCRIGVFTKIPTWGQRPTHGRAKSTVLGKLYAKISSHFEEIQDGRRAFEKLVHKNSFSDTKTYLVLDGNPVVNFQENSII